MPKKKRNFVRKSKIHKLKEVNVLREFQKRVSDGAGSRSAEDTNVEGVWNELKSCLIDSARESCGESKGLPIHSAYSESGLDCEWLIVVRLSDCDFRLRP